MADLLFIAMTVIFFALCLALIHFFDLLSRNTE